MTSTQSEDEAATIVSAIVVVLHQAVERVWRQVELEGPRSPRLVFALGIDLAKCQATDLLPAGVMLVDPVPAAAVRAACDVADSLRVAERLAERLPVNGYPRGVTAVKTAIRDLVQEARDLEA